MKILVLGASGVAGRVGEHRLDRLKRPQGKLRQPGLAIGERGARDRREIAGEHRGATDCCERHARGPRDRIHQHAFEGALAKLAEQQAEQKVLFVGRGFGHQLAQQLGTRGRGSGSRQRGQPLEPRIDVSKL